jgi:hypothetical protein
MLAVVVRPVSEEGDLLTLTAGSQPVGIRAIAHVNRS